MTCLHAPDNEVAKVAGEVIFTSMTGKSMPTSDIPRETFLKFEHGGKTVIINFCKHCGCLYFTASFPPK
jgi:hypothetical protein